jgi:hypothetical protein
MTIHSLYGGDVELSFDKEKHEYQVEGERVASVTQILRVLSKPALMPWAAKMTADHWLSSITPGVDYDEVVLEQIYKESKAAHRKKSTEAMTAGSLVHDYAEAYGRLQIDPTQPAPCLPINKQARRAIDGFRKWVDEHEVEFLETEFKVYSKTWSYCGTVDLDAVIDGKRTLLDYKTGTGGRIYPESFFQSAAYVEARADEWEYIGEEGIDYDQRATLCFDREKGTFRYKTRDMGVQFETDFKVFRGCLLASQGLQELKDED